MKLLECKLNHRGSHSPHRVILGFSKSTVSELSFLGASSLRNLKDQKAKVQGSFYVNKLSCEHGKQPNNKRHLRPRFQACVEGPHRKPFLSLAGQSFSETVMAHLTFKLYILDEFG